MTKTALSNIVFILLFLFTLQSELPLHAQEQELPREIRSALVGIAREHLVEQFEKIEKDGYVRGPDRNVVPLSGNVKIDTRVIRGWLGERLDTATGTRGTLTWSVKPNSPRRNLVLNCTRATWGQVPRTNNQWRFFFRFETTVPFSGRANYKGKALLIPGSASSNFFGKLNAEADVILIVTLNGTQPNFDRSSVERITVTQSGFAFTNEIAKLANRMLRSEVQRAINTEIKPKMAIQLNESLKDYNKNKSNGILNLVRDSAPTISRSPSVSPTYSLTGTWQSGNYILAVSGDGRFTRYTLNRGRETFRYRYNQSTGTLFAKDARGEEARVSIQWINQNSFRWTSQNGTVTYQKRSR